MMVSEKGGIRITALKTALLEALRSNLERHRHLVKQMREARKEKMIKDLRRALRMARKGTPVPDSELEWPDPPDHTEEYERAIQMLEMSVDETFTVDEQLFNCYVRDQWSWSRHFTTMSSAYLGG